MNAVYKAALESVERGMPVLIETSITGESGEIKSGMTKRITNNVMKPESESIRCIKAETEKTGTQTVFREPIFPSERLIVLGAGHIAVPVCEFAARLGFSVTVCDERPDFANTQRFPLAKAVICDSFSNAIESLGISEYDYIVIITRGHRYDADCLRKILPGTFPAYLGMIGSRRRVTGLLEMLSKEGYSRAALSRICTPIGLDIGAVTPEEIAVSILGEIVAYKRKPERYGIIRYFTDSDVELDIIRHLAASCEPEAIVTVIETRGSTPRGTGAKMAVNPIGQVVGSIGGGCSEGAVIREAVRIIGTGTYKTFDIDLTGDVAESEGMVCGGTMRVLIEDASAHE